MAATPFLVAASCQWLFSRHAGAFDRRLSRRFPPRACGGALLRSGLGPMNQHRESAIQALQRTAPAVTAPASGRRRCRHVGRHVSASTRRDRLRRWEEALSRGRSASTCQMRLRRFGEARSRGQSTTMQGQRYVDERRRAHPRMRGCLRQSISLRSVPRSLSLRALGVIERYPNSMR
jgi:hypothetical protein